MRVLALWCPDWPVTAAGFVPSDRVAVMEAARVCSTSAAARTAGVGVGLRRREAEARCSGLTVLVRDRVQEARAFEPVVAAIAGLTPKVEQTRPGLLSLDVRGPARYFGGEIAFRQLVLAAAGTAVPAGGPPPRVGIADGRFAAVLAARDDLIVAAGAAGAFLAPLPTSVLGQSDLVDLLGRLGVRRLGELAALPRASVLARFGVEVARLHDLSRGVDTDRIQADTRPEEVAVQTELDPPAERAESALFYARPLAEELLRRLAGRGHGCARVRIEAETDHGEAMSRLWRGDEDALGVAEIVERLRWQLDGWLSGAHTDATPTAGVAVLRLVADEVVPASGRQLALWGGRTDADRRAVRGLDRLSGMLGTGAVYTAALAGGRSPADRVVLIPWGDPAPPTTVALPWPGRHPPPAPATVYPEPLPADVADTAGAAVRVSARGRVSATPARLSIDGGPWATVADWAGPWTTDERFWDTNGRRRHARIQVLTGTGDAHLCVLVAGRWWIEATYD
ncbi:MAG: DNA polymerase Y family protein [Acidimicrobiales bacterium]